jgi:hypothetical protein
MFYAAQGVWCNNQLHVYIVKVLIERLSALIEQLYNEMSCWSISRERKSRFRIHLPLEIGSPLRNLLWKRGCFGQAQPAQNTTYPLALRGFPETRFDGMGQKEQGDEPGI